MTVSGRLQMSRSGSLATLLTAAIISALSNGGDDALWRVRQQRPLLSQPVIILD